MPKKNIVLTLLPGIGAAVVAAFAVPIPVPGGGSDKLGSPDPIESLKGGAIPPIPPKFEGTIGQPVADSKEWWPATIKQPKDAPNVVL